jgi:hypothetical protein
MKAPSAFWILALSVVVGCDSRMTSSIVDAGATASVTVHMPGALRVARALGSLSVEIDPSSRADLEVNVDPGMKLGVETESHVFVAGESFARGSARTASASGGDFNVGVVSWTLTHDGVPELDKKYVVEMHLVLFEVDATSARKTLLTRTLRQAEE